MGMRGDGIRIKCCIWCFVKTYTPATPNSSSGDDVASAESDGSIFDPLAPLAHAEVPRQSDSFGDVMSLARRQALTEEAKSSLSVVAP